MGAGLAVGAGVGVTTGVGTLAPMVIWTAACAVDVEPSGRVPVAVIAYMVGPCACCGVPEMTPVSASSARPAGRAGAT